MMMKGVNFVFKAVTGPATAGMKSFQNSLKSVQRQTQSVDTVNRSWMKGMSANRRTIQQMGFQVSDFAVQVGSGQSAMLAFVQQGGQMLQFFGAGGAVAATFLTVFGTLAIIATRSGMALSKLTPILGVFEDRFKGIVDAVVFMRETVIDAINLILNHFDTLLMIGAYVVSFFAVKLVASMIAASSVMIAFRAALLDIGLSFLFGGIKAGFMTAATYTLTGALNVLRTALMRLGIPLLIIGLAQVSVWLVKLHHATGSWAEVFSLLGDVVKGVWTGMVSEAKALVPRLAAVWNDLTGSFLDMIHDLAAHWSSFLGSMASGAEKVGWDSMAASLRNGVSDADKFASAMIAASEGARNTADAYRAVAATMTEAGWANAAAAIDKIRSLLGDGPGIDIRDWFGNGTKGSKELANALDDLMQKAREVTGQFQALGVLGTFGINDMKEAWVKFVQEMKTTSDPVGTVERFKKVLGELGKQAGDIYNAVRDPLEKMFMDMVDGTASVKDAFKSMAASVIKELFRILVVQKMVNAILGVFGISNPAMALPASAPVAAPSFAGGGFTGYGARSGGVDGKGGFPAILHPNETVTDHATGSGGGVTVNQTINVSTGVAQTVRAEIRTLMPQIAESAKTAVLDAKRRGGSYGSAMA